MIRRPGKGESQTPAWVLYVLLSTEKRWISPECRFGAELDIGEDASIELLFGFDPSSHYDLFAQSFAHGDGVQDPKIVDVILDVLRPFLVRSPDEKGFCRTRVSDGGEADFYVGLDGHGFMVNHFSPGETTELIVRAAQVARLVVLGPGLPPALTDAHQLAELPEPLSVGDPMPVLVETAEELEGLIADDSETYRRCRERLTSRS